MDIPLLAEKSHGKERNPAVHIKRDLYKSTVKSNDDVNYLRPKTKPPEQVVEELVEGLKTARSVEEMKDTCSVLTQHINHELSLTKQRLADQMKFLKNEWENALKLQQSSECEINSLKKQLEMIQIEYKLVDKSRVKTLQSQLQAAVSERENWKQRAEQLADLCETMQLVNSLQKSMSKEEDMHRDYAKKMKEMEMVAEEQETKMIYLTSQLQQTTLEYNTLIQERNLLTQELVQEREKSTKLQQIIDILRQKVLSNDSGDTPLANSCNTTTHTL